MHTTVRTRLLAAVAAPVGALVVVALAEAVAASRRTGPDAKAAAAGWLLLAVASLLGGTVGALRLSRSVIQPLAELTAFADDLLGAGFAPLLEAVDAGEVSTVEDLPAAPGGGGDELAALGWALEGVQERALALALEQAAQRRDASDALTNLGRRNQNLLSRQLDHISGIERQEVDPDRLDHLFTLDHLATRMRRNAESLLVLGGGESPRQWSAPVPVVDVVRSALAEVEDFRRVTLGSIEPAKLTGRATSDLAHLVAELVENALSFSPPHHEVLVDAATLADGYTIRIADRGLGMTPELMDEANACLAGTSVAGMPNRYLGLYVAGQLARRHGITVVLAAGAAGGLLASVALPSELLADPSPVPAGTGAAPSLASMIHPGTPEPSVSSAPPHVPAGPPPRPLAVARAAAPPPAAPSPAGLSPAPAPVAPIVPAVSLVPPPAPSALPPVATPATVGRTEAGAAPVAPIEVPAPTPVPATGPSSGGGWSGLHRPFGRRTERRRDDLLALLHDAEDETEAASARRLARTQQAQAAPPTPAPVPAVAPAEEEGDNPFEVWLDSRLEQLARLSVEQSVTAERPRPSGVARGEAGPGPVGDGAGLPRRRPRSGAEGPAEGLRRRAAPEVAAVAPLPDIDLQPEPPASPAEPAQTPRVTSSLFRYLSAVEGRGDHTEESASR